MTPLETWNAKNPSNHKTIKTAAISPNMFSTPFAFRRVPNRHLRLTLGTESTSRRIRPCANNDVTLGI
jgi:hypothetical protein